MRFRRIEDTDEHSRVGWGEKQKERRERIENLGGGRGIDGHSVMTSRV